MGAMLKGLRKLMGGSSRPLPAVPPGERVYAIGDIHGCLEHLDALIEGIDADIAAHPVDTVHLILLGDLVDRGPDSKGVVKRAMQLAEERGARVLGGNHEDMFLLAFKKPSALRSFLRYGGRETLLSYGIDKRELRESEIEELQAMMEERVPKKHRKFLKGLGDQLRIGDYVFVHAGIDPDIPLAEQRTHDMRWIREPFLSFDGEHEAVIVHGHTITDGIDVRRNRIGVDTGAYDSGVLTALVLEGTERRILSTKTKKGGIKVLSQEV